jgi:glycosyltransferase involved in cell wall biosynthesis
MQPLTALVQAWSELFVAPTGPELSLVTLNPAAAVPAVLAATAGIDTSAAPEITVDGWDGEPALDLSAPGGLDAAATWLRAYVASTAVAGHPQWYRARTSPTTGSVLLVGHEASLTGAPFALLGIARWLRHDAGWRVSTAVLRDGPLVPAFAELGPVILPVNGRLDLELAGVDVVYANTLATARFVMGTPALAHVPVVLHVHELWASVHALGQADVTAALRRADRIVTVSRAVTDMVESLVPERRGAIVRASELVEPTRADALRRPGAVTEDAAPDDFVVGGMGTIDMRKGADAFVRLASTTRAKLQTRAGGRPVRFVWIGRPTPDASLVQYDAERLDPAPGVKFLGELADPLPYLRRFDALAMTSREDPYPLVMLEAGLAGVPMVCFERSGGPQEFSATGAGLAVPYLDVDAMADALLLLRDHPYVAHAVGRAARAQVEFENRAELVAETCATVLDGLVARGR